MPHLRAVLIAGVAFLALAVGLVAAAPTASAQGPATATTTLRPGLNLAGWTEAEADAAALFEAIPRLDMAYAWDAAAQRFRWAARDGSGDLRTLTPGMGLWLALGGAEPFIWTRSMLPPGGVGLVPLREGWNLVAWSGRDGIAASEAFVGLDDVLLEAWDWNAEVRRRETYTPNTDANTLRTLEKGGAYWIRVSGAKRWWQFPPRVEFPDTFTPARQAELRVLVDEVVSFFIERTGIAVPDLTVRFSADRPESCGGFYDGNIRVISVDCFRPLAHEYTHAIQSYLRGHDSSGQPRGYAGPEAPVWITEGMANHWSGVYHASTGERPLDTYFAGTIFPEARRTKTALRFLTDYGILLAGDHSAKYSLSYLAIEYLVELTSEESLFTYYRKLFSANDWESAFREVFGLDTDQFYSMFEDHRARNFPPYGRIIGTVLGPNGEPLENVYVSVHSGLNRVAWLTQPDGTFRLSVEPGSYTVSFADHLAPECYFGWYDGDSELTARGEEAVLVTAGDADIESINIRLSATPAELCPRVSGTVLGPGGEPLKDVRVRGDPDGSGWTWQAVTGPDGAFAYPAEPGTYIVSFTNLPPDDCHFGWYDGDRDLTARGREAVPVTVGDAGVEGIDIRLPATPDELTSTLCARVEGVVSGPDGEPLSEIQVRLYRRDRLNEGAWTDTEGAFAILVPDGAYELSLSDEGCDLGLYDSNGERWTGVGRPPVVTVADAADVTGIVIRLSQPLAELCPP